MKFGSVVAVSMMFIVNAPSLAQDPPGTRVLRPGTSLISSPERSTSLDANEVSRLYRHNGSPRILLFIDRELQDIVGEWETYSRAVSEQTMSSDLAVNSSESVACTFIIQRISNTNACSYRIADFSESRNRRDAQQRHVEVGSELHRDQFEAGFQSTLLEYGLLLVDREIVIRQASLGSNEDVDFYDLEMSSLNGYADYVAEVLIVPDPASEFGMSYRSNINSVNTGQIIAVSVSNGQEGLLPTITERWQPVANGYEKVVDIVLPQFSAFESGQKVAENLLSAMLNTWRNSQ